MQKLKAGLVFMQPGGRTELESEESRDRIEDAVCAVKAALNQGGFVTGGGSALLKASLALNSYVEEMSER
jgi:chaperonin GroEL